MAPLHFSARTQTPQPAGPKMRVGIGREEPQPPVSPAQSPTLCALAPQPGWSYPGPAEVVPRALPLRGAPALATQAKKQHPARHGGGTSAGAPNPRSARAQGPPAHLRSPGAGQSRAGYRNDRGAGPHRHGLRQLRSVRRAPAARRRRASPTRPARRRLTARRDGHPEHERSLLPLVPLPCPGPRRRPPPARQRGSLALTEVRRDALPPPAACSPRPAARAIVAFWRSWEEGKKGGREGGGKGLRSREREVCKGRKWRRPRPVREINGNQSPGSQQRNLLPQRSAAQPGLQPRAAEPPLPPAALGPGPSGGVGAAPLPSPKPRSRTGGREGSSRAGPAGPRGDAMGTGGGGGEEDRAPRLTAFLLSLPRRGDTARLLSKTLRALGSSRRGAACGAERKEGGAQEARFLRQERGRWLPSGSCEPGSSRAFLSSAG